jgi:AraC-like DNA-binding protein
MENAYSVGDYDLTVGEVVIAHKNQWLRRFFDYRYGRHVYGFVYCLEHSALFDFGTEKIRLRAGELLFLSEKSSYSVYTEGDEPFSHMTVNFSLLCTECAEGSVIDELLSGKRIHVFQKADAYGVREKMERLVTLWRARQYGYRMAARALIYELLCAYISDACRACGESEEYRHILPAKKYIEEHYREDIAVSDLAAICNLSETHLRRLFARVLACSPTEYRLRLRMIEAKYLLLSGDHSVAEAAEAVGFEDANYFSRVFKKHTGQSPTAFARIL